MSKRYTLGGLFGDVEIGKGGPRLQSEGFSFFPSGRVALKTNDDSAMAPAIVREMSYGPGGGVFPAPPGLEVLTTQRDVTLVSSGGGGIFNVGATLGAKSGFAAFSKIHVRIFGMRSVSDFTSNIITHFVLEEFWTLQSSPPSSAIIIRQDGDTGPTGVSLGVDVGATIELFLKVNEGTVSGKTVTVNAMVDIVGPMDGPPPS